MTIGRILTTAALIAAIVPTAAPADEPVARKKIVVTGHSRYGKAAPT